MDDQLGLDPGGGGIYNLLGGGSGDDYQTGGFGGIDLNVVLPCYTVK